jgi:hypothetical protein
MELRAEFVMPVVRDISTSPEFLIFSPFPGVVAFAGISVNGNSISAIPAPVYQILRMEEECASVPLSFEA